METGKRSYIAEPISWIPISTFSFASKHANWPKVKNVKKKKKEPDEYLNCILILTSNFIKAKIHLENLSWK